QFTALAYGMLLRTKIEPDPERLSELRRFIRESDGAAPPEVLKELEPYVDFLPCPREATLNVARQALQQKHQIMEVGVSSMESPSTRLAMELALGLPRGSMKVGVAQIQTPDPRVPRVPVKYLLWRYEGTDPY